MMERKRVSSFRSRWAVGLTLMLAVAATGPGIARGQQPPADALARYVPRQDSLFLYLEYDGLDAHRGAWEQSSAYKLLNQTRLGPLVEDLVTQVIDATQQGRPEDQRLKPAELIGIFKMAAMRGFVTAFWGANPREGEFVLAARGADRPEIIHLLESAARGRQLEEPAPIAGRRLHALDRDLSWWVEKGDLVIASRPQAIISVIDGQAPNVADHPLRATLRKKAHGFEPVAVGFLDLKPLPPMPPQAVQVGLDGLKRVELQWGIQDEAMLAVVKVVAPRPRRGVLAMLDQPTFSADSLPPLPAGLKGFAVLSIDLDRTYGRIVELTRQTDPQGAEGFAQLERAVRQRFNFDLRKDILAHLGPKVAVYSQSTPGAGGFSAMAMIGQIAGLTIAVEAKDKALSENLDKLIEAINLIVKSRQASANGGQPPAGPSTIAFRKQQADQPTYVLNLPTGTVPPAARMLMRPTLKLGKDQLVLGASPAAANRNFNVAALPADQRWKATDKFATMAERLPRDMILLSVGDPRETLPGFVEGLPALVQQANMLFPAVHAAREAARRAQCSNNLKQLGLAMHIYNNTFNAYPPPSIASKDGKPLLSWRVALLPYLEHASLYNKFHLDEPWDSPHNKALIKEMPPVFTCPDRDNPAPGTTTYRRITGPGALAEAGRPRRMSEIFDGVSNTILAVEAKEAVIWTKPDSDLPFDPAAPASLYGAGSPHPEGLQVLMADGAVRFLPETIDPKMFRSMITFNQREVIDWSKVPQATPPRPKTTTGPLHLDADKLPKADELKPLLFPSSLAITTEEDGFRLVAREPIPTISSPTATGVMVALLLPAVQAAREAARRAQCVGHLKQIALAFHNYHDASGAFPKPATIGKDGKSLLSWRVEILPYLQQKELYDRFHRDEPWDSPHNKALIKEMPEVYLCPSRPNAQAGTTTYRAIVGDGAMFEEGRGTPVAQVTDGTSNTVMVVESPQAVPWTKPDELKFDPKAQPTLLGAGSPHPGGFNAAFADGAIHFIKTSINLQTWRALITRAGGEVVSADSY